MSALKLALVGGGAKSQSILARVATARMIRNRFGGSPVSSGLKIDLFEPIGAGSTWLNGQGYTDGRQTLCTSPFRDVTFTGGAFKLDEATPPTGEYQDATFMRELRSQFSFQAFLDSGSAGDAIGFNAWVDADLPPVHHKVFGGYLSWVCSKSMGLLEADGTLFHHSVETISREPDGWYLHCDNRATYGPYAGVVHSGVGKPVVRNQDFELRRLDAGGIDAGLIAPDDIPSYGGQKQLIDLMGYWSDRDQTIKRLVMAVESDGRSAHVSIIGDGGAAMAVAMDLVGSDLDCDVKIIGRRPAPEYRVRNIFADRYYGNDELWQALSIAERNGFARYYGSGSVWFENVDALQKSQRVVHVGREAKIVAFFGPQIVVTLSRDGAPFFTDLVIDCRGYDPKTAFIRMLGGSASVLGASVESIIEVHRRSFVYETVVNLAKTDRSGFMDQRKFEFVLETLSGTLYDCCFSPSFEVRNPWRCLAGDPEGYARRFTPDLSVYDARSLIRVACDALYDLCGESEFPEGLHAPNFASIKGPAASNLMALGWVGRHITAKYGLI